VLAGAALLTLPTRTDGKRRLPERPTERHTWIRMMLREALPPRASVAAQFDLFCQVPYRSRLYPLSLRTVARAEYWVVDANGFLGDLSSRDLEAILARASRLLAEGQGRIVVQERGLLVFQNLAVRTAPDALGGRD